MKKIAIRTLIACLIFSLGFTASHVIDISKDNSLSSEYPLLAKRLFLDNPNDVQFDFRKLKSSLEADLVAGLGDNEKKVSVYFEYLPSNISISVNPELRAVAASLMKTAVAMEVYKSIENGRLNKEDKITLTEEMLDPGFGTLYESGVGSTYTIEELLTTMLQESDNTAAQALKSAIGKPLEALNILSVLDIKTTTDVNKRITVNTKEYSQIFKCLYLACYNSKTHSQEILNTLTGSSATNRLKKLLPEDVVVAHKIGSFNNEYQSDCGVVYANEGNSNYLICVMVNSEDPEASQEIARVSYKVYSYIKSLQ